MRGTTINIDTGGTFTDAFVVRDGTRITVKVLTTPHDLAVCFRDVIARAAEEIGETVPELLRETATVRYATTVGTNAIIQRSGPRLGLIAGEGGERLYSGNGQAEQAFDLFLDPHMVASVPAGAERSSVAVEAVRSLLANSARGLVCALPAADRDPAAELAVREQFEQHYPKHCLDAVPLLLSHEIAADPDDFRRAVTTIFNAYVHPAVADFLYRAEDHLRDNGYRRPLLVVHNDGGCSRVAKTIAGRTYNSGPLAGLMGAKVIAELYGIKHLVTMDMGGTSLDVAFVVDGEVPLRDNGLVEGIEISFPLPDLLALGAGGGSIAHRDEGELRVGPQSAGAKPGPACFGFGGTDPTVTDSDVVLGILHPERFLGGTMPLHRDLAERAIGTLGDDVVALAAEIRTSVHRDTGAQIAKELTAHGLDPAETVLLAFGGNGPAHACGIAEVAGIAEILTVPFASVFSAFGASSADVRHTYEEPAGDGVADTLRERAVRDMRGEGFKADALEFESGESEREGETLTRLGVRAQLDHYAFARTNGRGSNGASGGSPRETRQVVWPGHGPVDTPIHTGAALHAGTPIAGPAVIEAPDCTHVIPHGWTYTVDEYGNGRLKRSTT